jgi:hypothetical protein
MALLSNCKPSLLNRLTPPSIGPPPLGISECLNFEPTPRKLSAARERKSNVRNSFDVSSKRGDRDKRFSLASSARALR